jgi:hypothetical protein
MTKYIKVAFLALGVIAMMTPSAMAQDDKPFTIHGEVRVRAEYTTNAVDFEDSGNISGISDQALYYPYRIRIAAEGHFTKNVSAWIEFQNADTFGDAGIFGNGPTRTGVGFDGSDVEMYQGNMTLDKLWSDSFSLQIGRMEIVAGNELLLGDLDFYSGLSHDGGVGMWDFDNVDVMVWYTRPFESGAVGFSAAIPPDQIGPIPDGNTDFVGGYADWTFSGDQTFDVYVMNLNGPFGGVNVWTVGGRYAHDKTDANGFIWNVEYAQQFGDAVTQPTAVDAEGSVFEGWLGYNLVRGDNVHRFYGRYAQATGDDTGSSEFEGFIPLFGDFHNRTGRGDWFQLANASTGLGGGATGGLTAFSVGYNGFYNDRHEFGAAYWTYTLEEDSGGPVDDLGDAIDVWYGFNYSRNVNFVVSLSQFSPDDVLVAPGAPDDDVVRLYGQARLRF